MNKYKAVLFDFDGTVMDTNEIILQSWQHVFDYMGQEMDKDKVTITFGEPLIDTMPHMFPGCDPEKLVDVYRECQREMWDKPILMFPGIKELIEELKNRGFMVAMVTSRVWASTHMGLYHFDISDMFDAVVSAADTTVHKPNPYPIQLCLEKLGIAPKDAVMVGDSHFDIECAYNAGVDSVAVNWSICYPKSIRTGVWKPSYEIDSAEELLSVVCE